jgi:hypothetical protein
MTGDRHPNPQELLQGAIRTLEEVLMPELQSTWAKTSALGLLGQLRYALARGSKDSLAEQNEELEACVKGLLDEFPDLRALAADIETSGDRSWDLREQAGRLLVFALAKETAACRAVRERLRPLLIAHVGQDLGESGPMLQAFLASGSLGSTG